uniref:GP-PDE domain-containing protein n=1 Tax=Spongospora subterranea TaxID=70186 RepID=A0A0H5QT02_9EUKA|eukprot:CRZ05090.1 hypothetical protein [Spongospora subterranea]
MKFGHKLRTTRLPKWTNRYIAYSSLKAMIKTTRLQMIKDGSDHPTPKQIQMFIERIKSERKKVESFLVAKLQQMDVRKKVIGNRVQELDSLSKSARTASAISLEQALSVCEQELNHIREFCDLNQIGFGKIAKKFDKQCPGGEVVRTLQTMVSVLDDCTRLDALLKWCQEQRASLRSIDLPHSNVLENLLNSLSIRSDSDGVNLTSALPPSTDIHYMISHGIEGDAIEATLELIPLVKDIDALDAEGNSLLTLACQRGLTLVVSALLKHGASISTVTRFDRSALHVAVIAGSLGCTQILIEAQSGLNVKDVELHCPLHYAALLNFSSIASALIEADAKINVRDMEGNTPLALAARQGNLDVAVLLLEAGARVDAFNWYGQVPLHLASRFGHMNCVQALVRCGAKIDSYDVIGRSPIHEAARRGFVDTLKMLIVAVSNGKGRNASESVLAISTAADVEGLTPLHSAAYYGHSECVRVLLSESCDPEPLDRLGWTPRDYALYCGFLSLSDLFPTPPADSIVAPDLDNDIYSSDKRQLSVHYEEAKEEEHIFVNDDGRSVPGNRAVAPKSPSHAEGYAKLTFRVRARVHSDRYVCICGNISEFGSWDPAYAVSMVEDIAAVNVGAPPDVMDSTEDALSTWTITIVQPIGNVIEYKYLIMYQNVLEVWETLPSNRVIGPMTHDVNIIDDGVFGYHDGENWTSQGWLVEDFQLHIRLGHVTQLDKNPCIRLFGPETPDLIEIGYIANSRKIKRQVPLPMHDQLETIKFQLRRYEDGKLPEFSIVFDVFCGKGFRVGTGHVMSSSLLREMEGFSTIPLMSSLTQSPIGECHFEYLLARPFIHQNMKTVLCRCFSKSTKLIGHRGAGATRYLSKQPQHMLRTQENTILSFVTAAALGAEYIEFDVQLTKDFVPIIYHDWAFHLPRLHGIPPIPVSAITLKEFLELRSLASDKPKRTLDDVDLHHQRRKMSLDPHSIANEIRDKYPLLIDCFKQVPAHVGFNVELKYPPEITRAETGFKFPSRNDYVDAVLKSVFEHAGSRRIMFSSFDPDICTLACLKQPSYPVFFLTEAGASPCWDPRGQSIREAIRFAKRQNLVGIVSYADPLLKSPKIITTVKAAGLVLATWSSANNEISNIELSHRFGIDAIVIDKIAYVDTEARENNGDKVGLVSHPKSN